MLVEVLVSTMNQPDLSLVDKMRIDSNAVIVNQCDIDERREFFKNGHTIKWINTTTRGLSVSRNICLKEASGDICLIADDDIEYVDNYVGIVRKAFLEHDNIDIMRFKVIGIEKEFKKYPSKVQRIGYLKSFKSASVELAFKRKSVSKISFDESIGAGTDFCMGEENAFLIHCLKNKLKMLFIPEIISYLHVLNSSWQNISPKQYLISRGASFEAMETNYTHFFIIQFALRKRAIFSNDYSILSAIREMENGRNKYIENKKLLQNNNTIDAK